MGTFSKFNTTKTGGHFFLKLFACCRVGSPNKLLFKNWGSAPKFVRGGGRSFRHNRVINFRRFSTFRRRLARVVPRAMLRVPFLGTPAVGVKPPTTPTTPSVKEYQTRLRVLGCTSCYIPAISHHTCLLYTSDAADE